MVGLYIGIGLAVGCAILATISGIIYIKKKSS
jgi:hypothetical protein